MPAATPPDRFELFGQALDRLGTALERRLAPVLAAVAAALERAGEEEADARERQALYAVAAMLRIEARARIASVDGALHERAHRCLEYVRRAGNDARALALMEEEELRAQLLAADLARAARQVSATEYAGYAARVGALMPGLWQSDDLNPLGARTLAAASLAAFGELGESTVATVVLRAALLTHLPQALGLAIDEVHRWLRTHGVKPQGAVESQPTPTPTPGDDSIANVTRRSPQERAPPMVPPQEKRAEPPAPAAEPPREAVPSPESARTPEAASAPAPQAPAGAPTQRPMDLAAQAADVARVLATSPLSASDAGPRLTVLPTLQPVVELERDAVAFAHSIGAVPYSHEARVAYFGNVRTRLRAANAPQSQIALVDVVAAMFDYVIDDRRVPEAVKPLIWRLQQPTVALTLLDPAFLGDEPRSLRRLIENLGAIANAFADDFARGSELHRRIDTVVRAVEIVASALQTRSAVMARQVEHEHKRASRSVVQLIERVVQERSTLESTPDKRNRRDYRKRPDVDRERGVTARLTELLSERIDRHSVPDSVREFVLNVWLRHLRTAILRAGEESDEFRLALQVVDDLLWSLDTGRERQSRRELAQRIPPLIGMLTQGLRSVGAKDDEFKAFFDELFLIHLRKMQRRGRSGDAGQTGSGSRQRDTKSGPRSRTRAPGRGDTDRFDAATDTLLEDLPASRASGPVFAEPEVPAIADLDGEEAPAREPDLAPQSSEHKLLEVLASLDLTDLPDNPRPIDETAERAFGALSRGDWLRIEGRDGAPLHVKVAWINARRTVVLMVRHPDRRALSMRAAELLDRLRSGRARRVH